MNIIASKKRKYLKQYSKLLSKITIGKIAKLFFTLGVAFSLFQLEIILQENLIWSGQFNPYTSTILYLSDLFFTISFFFFATHVFFHSKNTFFSLGTPITKTVVFTSLSIITLSYFMNDNKDITFFWILQWFKFTSIYLIIINRFIRNNKLIHLLLIMLSIQAIIGIIQFLIQSSIGLTILGESHISPEILNVAKIDINNIKILRPYGTLKHANILGGLMSFGLILTTYLNQTKAIKKNLNRFYTIIFAITLILSFSRSAWLATIISFFTYLAFRQWKIKYSTIKSISYITILCIALISITGVIDLLKIRLNIFNDPSVISRFYQMKTSIITMIHNPFGVGLGNYTNTIQQYSDTKLMPWEFEPVHNVFLLIGAELGVLSMIAGVLAIILIIKRLFKKLNHLEGKYKKFPIYLTIIFIIHTLILASFDHYLYTNNSAIIFTIIIAGICTNLVRNTDNGIPTIKNSKE